MIETRQAAKEKLLEAKVQLEEASAVSLNTLSPPERDEAQQELDVALREFEAAEREFNRTLVQENSLQADELFRDAFVNTKESLIAVTAKDILELASQDLNEIQEKADSEQATELIDSLRDSLRRYESTQERLQNARPNSNDHERLRRSLKNHGRDLKIATNQIVNFEPFSLGIEDLNTQEKLQNILVVNATGLQASRASLVSRLQVVLDELERKGGETESYDNYIRAISGVDFDVTNTEGLGLRVTTWLQSENGGIRLGLGFAKFFSILMAAIILAPRLG